MSVRRTMTVWLALWAPGLLVAVGAGVATAHGLYEVAAAAGVPTSLAGLYPVITDGLALVAYVSTARLAGSHRRYAWTVVVASAGLSGLAQAVYLAGGLHTAGHALRFGVGAWPAIAAAVVAHLLFLLGHRASSVDDVATRAPKPVLAPAVQTVHPVQRPDAAEPVQRPAERTRATQPAHHREAAGPSPARDRARAAARRYAATHDGQLPTTSVLMKLADVSRGSAGNALKTLREQPSQLQAVHDAEDVINQ